MHFADWHLWNSPLSFDKFEYCSAVVKYGIERRDIVLGRILGEGFFGEVYDGVYKKAVSASSGTVDYVLSVLFAQMCSMCMYGIIMAFFVF